MIKLNIDGLGLNKDSKEFKLLNELMELLNYKGYCGSLDLNIDKIERNVGNTLVERWNYWKSDPEKSYNCVPDELQLYSLNKALPDNQLALFLKVEWNGNNCVCNVVDLLDDLLSTYIDINYTFDDLNEDRNEYLIKESLEALSYLDFNYLNEEMFEKFKSECPYQLFKDLVELMNYLIKYCPHYYEN